MGISDFLKRTKLKEKAPVNELKSDVTQNIQIEIEDSTGLFENEKEQIIQGAKQLLEMGKADNMEEAIIIIAVMFRGLKYNETKESANGKIVVLRETAKQSNIEIVDDEIEL